MIDKIGRPNKLKPLNVQRLMELIGFLKLKLKTKQAIGLVTFKKKESIVRIYFLPGPSFQSTIYLIMLMLIIIIEK